jgi:predicted O-methyltransferase YrrM
MIDDSVATEEITLYLRSLLPKQDEFIESLSKKALEEYIPVVPPEEAQFICTLFAVAKPKNVLEIGTAIGYSSIIFSRVLEDAHITTVEIDENMVQAAKNNIKADGRQDKIDVIHGNGLDVLDTLFDEGKRFDCIFVDAAKGQYLNFFEKCMRVLTPGGMLLSDNVLYRGTVAKEGFIPRKHRTIIRNLKEYLNILSTDSRLKTSILPIGDGLAVSTKISEE